MGNGRLFGLASVIILSGCTNLEAVRTISAKMTTASQGWGAVTGEFAASCGRRQQFNAAVVDCSVETAASAGLGNVNRILQGYFSALRDSASDQNFTVQPGIDAVTGSVSNIPGINTDEVAAASGLFSLLARWATEAARERALRELIRDGVPPAKRLVGTLDRLVVDNLTSTLDAEQSRLTYEFAVFSARAGAAVAPAEMLAMCERGPRSASFTAGSNFLLALEFCRRTLDLRAKRTALTAYRGSLGDVGVALDELASAKSKLDSRQLVSRLYENGRALDEKRRAVAKAFGTGEDA